MRGKIQLRLDLDAHGRKAVAGFRVGLGRMQERLGRHAPDVEAGAAIRGPLLDHGHLHAELRGADSAHVSPGAGADDDEIVSHSLSAQLSFSACQAKDFSLPNSATAKRVTSEIDLVAIIIQPENGMPVILQLHVIETSGRLAEELEDLTFCNNSGANRRSPRIHPAR